MRNTRLELASVGAFALIVTGLLRRESCAKSWGSAAVFDKSSYVATAIQTQEE